MLFSLQGSLYELDKVSFIHTCLNEGSETSFASFIIIFSSAASESHREVYASPGVPSQQGVRLTC